MLPVVAFQRRMRPSFPAEAKTVLVYHMSEQRNSKGGVWGAYPVVFHSTLDTADLERIRKQTKRY